MANETTLNMTLKLRRAEFTDSCVLLEGEPGYHTSTHEFKIGDGSTPWGQLKLANETQIEAIINAAIAAEAQARSTADTNIRTDFAAADTTTLNTAKSYADTKKSEVIGASGNASTASTIYGAKKYAEEKASAAQSAAINTAAADATSKANAAEAAAKSHAETKASEAETAAKNYADAQDTALETSLIGGDTDTTYAKTIKGAKAFAKSYADGIVATEKTNRESADTALGNRITTVENKLANVSNVMDFVGAKTALPSEGSNQNGDVIVVTAGDNAGKEFVYDDSREAGKKWVEFGSTSATDSAVAALKSRMDAAEETIGDNASDITTLGTTKLDKSVYNAYIDGKSMSDAELKSYTDSKAAALDDTLHTVISKEIDDDVKAAIDDEVTRSNAKAKELADAAQSAAEAAAEAKDAARYTTVTTDIATAKQAAIATAKAYTDAREIEIKKYADQAESDAVATAKSYTDGREVEIKKYADQAETDAIDTAKEYTDSQDAATLAAAKNYTDTKVAGAVTKVTAGNADIVVTPTGGTGDVTVAHKTYGSGTYTKTPESSTKTGDIYFFDSIATSNGHITGGTMKSLASILEGMTFIFDGGTSAD